MTGIRISDATVWLTKVAAVRQNSRMITRAIQGWANGSAAGETTRVESVYHNQSVMTHTMPLQYNDSVPTYQQ
jgi:hypothetical protein